MKSHVIFAALLLSACAAPGGDDRSGLTAGGINSAGAPSGGAPSSGGASSQGGMPAVTPPAAQAFPCDVLTVVQNKCWTCHSTPTNYGAPMSLLQDSDVHKTTRDGTEQIYQRMAKRIHDSSSSMPPAGFPKLTASELATLDAWIARGAPAGTGCSVPPGSGGAPSMGGTTGAGGATPIVPTALPNGGATKPDPEDMPVEPAPSECDMVQFHARNDANGTKFNVPAGEQYYCFGFHQDWGTGTQGLAFYPNIDNRQVIHHWLLYKAISPQINGSNNACLGFHPDGELLAGWAPGAMPTFMPAHVGVDLGGGDYILEVHYNNTGAPTQDASGVTVCKAKQPRPETATVSWLGTEAIILPPMAKGLQVPSNCKPNITDRPIHIIRSWPHMHRLGRHMKADIHRADGTVDPLFNVDFDFNSQWGYDTPAVLNAGDWVQTTCTFDNDTPNVVTFGEQTSNEMCYNFTYAYPARALVTFGLMTTACNN